jgi:hypothetical protein
MEIVLTHIGTNVLPSYIDVTIRQIRRFNKDVLITFITGRNNFDTIIGIDASINVVDDQSVRSDKVPQILALVKRDENDFWGATLSRLLYIEEYMKRFDKTDVIHFENDVLIYFDLKTHEDSILKFRNLAITKGGNSQIMTGFFYIKSHRSLEHMTDYWIDLLEKYRLRVLRRKYGIGMMNEMSLLFIYSKSFNKEYLDYFPILPEGEHAYNIESFYSLFDPASYGQYVGGTDKNKVPGFLHESHYIGKEMLDHPDDYEVVWLLEKGDVCVPGLKYGRSIMKINNLHIHSKRLSDFASE